MSKQDLKFVIDHFTNYQQPEWKIEDDVRTACVAAILRWRPYTTDHIHPTTSIPSSIQDFLSQPWFNDCHGEADILYMRRALNPKDPWSGHIAFPGGKNEAIDKTPFDTVVRECKEETGLDLASPAFILLGTLDPIVLTSLKTRNPTMRLIPHIFLQVTPVTPQITIRPSEVSEITYFKIHLMGIQGHQLSIC
ncbi:uncharacterized protein EV154DRAFT_518761 [Mucor mucedo]|uniref:uncharacterized protein n=1 Tax=Mucor mucedo TaxID=29922 RepID=UPI0022206EF3|nr:uncharacterized protein EV154DRAFT_518761 [Mucor mucedo]KAI7888116.1 hypothetical protein EV154DRAFT_518761 [Mucor mucedo]